MPPLTSSTQVVIGSLIVLLPTIFYKSYLTSYQIHRFHRQRIHPSTTRTSSSTMASTYSAIPNSPPSRKHFGSDDLSVISEGTSTSLSSGEDSNLQCSSPSSCHSMSPKQIKLVFDQDAKAVQKLGIPSLSSKTILQHCYGTADLSDRIGRTLSVLLVARLALSVLLATIEGVEEL